MIDKIFEGTHIEKIFEKIEQIFEKIEQDINRITCNVTAHDYEKPDYIKMLGSEYLIYGKKCKRCNVFEEVRADPNKETK